METVYARSTACPIGGIYSQLHMKSKTRLQKIEDVENPVVGQFYLVPHVQLLEHAESEGRWAGGYKQGDWIPVIGDVHRDADLGVDADHYHYDPRFTKVEMRYGAVVNLYYLGREMPEHRIINAEVMYKRRKMLREAPVFPQHVRWMQEFKERYKDNTVQRKAGVKVCPHKGFPVSAGSPLPCGARVCPGHGLIWNEDGTQKI